MFCERQSSVSPSKKRESEQKEQEMGSGPQSSSPLSIEQIRSRISAAEDEGCEEGMAVEYMTDAAIDMIVETLGIGSLREHLGDEHDRWHDALTDLRCVLIEYGQQLHSENVRGLRDELYGGQGA